MPNTQPWEYQEEERRHKTTGAIGARTPQGDIVYGPLAQQFLTPIESVPKITIPETEAPATAPGMALIDRTPESWLLDQQRQLQESIAAQQRQLEETQAERKGLIDQAKDFFSVVPKMETSVRDLQQEFGIQAMRQMQQQTLDSAMALRNQAILLSEQRDAAIGTLMQQGRSPYLSAQQARIAESFDRRINTLAAQEATQVALFQAQQGQIDQARALVSDIVNAMTYDTNLELTKMQMFLDINRDEISMLDTSIQRDLNEVTRQLENELNQERQERTAVLELMLQYNSAGISANDTLENAVIKSQQWLGIQPDASAMQIVSSYPSAFADLSPQEIEKLSVAEAITRVARMPQAASKPQVFGGQQTGYFAWTQDAQGNWVAQQVIPGTAGITKPEDPMSILDVKRYEEMYPAAGIMIGDTPKEAERKVALKYTIEPEIISIIRNNPQDPSTAVREALESAYGVMDIPEDVKAIANNLLLEEGSLSYGDRFWRGVDRIFDRIF